MTSVDNLFSNIGFLEDDNSINDNASIYENYENYDNNGFTSSPSLNQGEKYKNLTNFLKSMDTTKLNTWELEFCNSVIEKLNKSEEHILLSNKQHQVLVNIHKKHGQ